MSNILTLPTSWACSATQAERNRKREDIMDAAAALLQLQSWQNVAECYRYSIGEELRPWQLVDLATYPVDAKVIIYAIHATARARRPSYYYLQAILTNCVIEGCTTPEAYIERDLRHREAWNGVYQHCDAAAR